MDISKEPLKPPLSQVPTNDTRPAVSAVISQLSDLNLQPGKHYNAVVIQSRQSQQAAQLSSTAEQASTATTGKQDNLLNLLNNEYLLRVNAKTLLISSERPLTPGQKLLLSLDPGAPIEKPGLIAQLRLEPSSPRLNNSAVSQLLQALNQSLNTQLPLHSGLTALTQAALHPATGLSNVSIGAQDNTGTQLLDSIRNQLQAILPKTNDLFISHAGNIQTSENSASAIKSAMLHSGLFLEHTLVNKVNTLELFKAQFAALDQNKQVPPNQSLQNQTPQNNSAPTQTTAALNKIQQTIEALLQAAGKSAGKDTPLQTDKSLQSFPGQSLPGMTQHVLARDLKASLLSLTAQAASTLPAELSATQIKQLFGSPLLEQATLASPFAFPMIDSAKSQAVKALFEQKFTTGQLLKLLASMIHRLQFNQLHSLLQSSSPATDTPTQQTWFFELPILNTQQTLSSFQFRIDQEAQQSTDTKDEEAQKKRQWKILLSFDLDQLGPIYIQVKLLESHISSTIWADRDGTLKLLEQEAQHFKSCLEKLGLTVDTLHCQQGQPRQTQTKLDQHLVDTKA